MRERGFRPRDEGDNPAILFQGEAASVKMRSPRLSPVNRIAARVFR
jgi:hypothetical protein